MTDYYQQYSNQSTLQSTSKRVDKRVDDFDDIFSFELNIEKHLTPAQLAQIQVEKTAKDFFTDGKWLATAEQRSAFQLLSPRQQLIATFGNCSGYIGSELQAIAEILPG